MRVSKRHLQGIGATRVRVRFARTNYEQGELSVLIRTIDTYRYWLRLCWHVTIPVGFHPAVRFVDNI